MVSDITDETLKDTVKQFKTEAYYSGNTGGNEPRQYLVGDKNVAPSYTDLGGITNWKDYGYLRISTNIYIGDSDDGLAFRIRRRNASDDTELAEDIYIGIGGSKFSSGTIQDGYRYIDNSLEVGKWHNVVIELGSNKTNVNFYIDNKLSINTQMKKIANKSSTTDVITGFPEGTYGFGGPSNRCVLIPKSANSTSNGDKPLDLRLHNFSMVATDDAYTPDTNAFYIEDASATITSTGKIAALANVYNYTGEDKDLCIIMAAYKENEDGTVSLAKVYHVPTEESTFGAGFTRFSSEEYEEPEGEYNMVKVFFWDKEMTPVINPVVEKKPVEILVIGCSFTGDSIKYVYKIAESLGIPMRVHHYMHSGGSIQSLYESRDSSKSVAGRADSWYYSLNNDQQKYSSIGEGKNPTLEKFLETNKVKAVIMQNYWSRSEHIAEYAKPEDYTPAIGENGNPERIYYPSPYYVKMAEFIKEKQPDAEVIINSVWSNEQGYIMANYVKDNYASEGFENESAFMYDLLEKYNGQSAIDVGATVLPDGSTIGVNGNPITQFPAGYAIQYARNWKDENGENIFYTVKNPNDFHGWESDKLYLAPVYEGKIRLNRDGFHLSPAGRYLVGCVWIEMLTGLDVRNATYKPEYDDSFTGQALDEYGNTIGESGKYYYDEMDDETAALIRQIAHEAVEKFKSQGVRGLDDPSLEF